MTILPLEKTLERLERGKIIGHENTFLYITVCIYAYILYIHIQIFCCVIFFCLRFLIIINLNNKLGGKKLLAENKWNTSIMSKKRIK